MLAPSSKAKTDTPVHPLAQPDAARQRGVVQLLDALEARLMHRDDQPQMPPEFLEQFAARFEEEGLPDLVNSWGEWTWFACCCFLPPCSANMVPEG
jgi:hypothetical protein